MNAFRGVMQPKHMTEIHRGSAIDETISLTAGPSAALPKNNN
jgi:hypothetical protein